MTLNIHVYLHGDSDLARLIALVQKLGEKMTNEFDQLKTSVANNSSVTQSALTLIQGFKARLDAAGTDPTALKALSDQLGTDDTALAAAVAANTPAA